MPNEPKYQQQVYGFNPDRDYSWPQRVEDPRLNPPDREADHEYREQKALAEVVESIKEATTINPRVGQEIRRILEEPKAAPAPPQRAESPAAATAPAPPVVHAPLAPTPATTPSPAPQTPSVERKRTPRSSRPAKPLSRLARHKAHCCICGASDQEQIEEAFLDWENVSSIAHEHKIDRRAIYRHVHATGLFDQRDLNIRRALGHLIHEAGRVSVSADSIVRAVRLFTHINTRGEFVQPPTQVVFTSAMAMAAASATASAGPASAAPAAITIDVPHKLPTSEKLAPGLRAQSADPTRIGVPSKRSAPRDLSGSRSIITPRSDTPRKAKSRVTHSKQTKVTHAKRHTFSKRHARRKG